MLGEQIAQESGEVTSRRVLDLDDGPMVEVSFAGEGTLLGVATRVIATYRSQLRPDGSIFGEGQGIVMGADGQTASWRGGGVGAFDGKGGTNFRGAIYYSSTAPAWQRLNTVGGVFEFSEAADGGTEGRLWEWK